MNSFVLEKVVLGILSVLFNMTILFRGVQKPPTRRSWSVQWLKGRAHSLQSGDLVLRKSFLFLRPGMLLSIKIDAIELAVPVTQDKAVLYILNGVSLGTVCVRWVLMIYWSTAVEVPRSEYQSAVEEIRIFPFFLDLVVVVLGIYRRSQSATSSLGMHTSITGQSSNGCCMVLASFTYPPRQTVMAARI